MADPAAISIAFIERRPLAAARTLMDIEPGDAAALLEKMPSRFAVRLFEHIDPWAASAVVERMTAESAAALLRALDAADGAAILRLLPPDGRESVLVQLPQKLRRDLEISLSYPPDTVGAHMSTAFLAMLRTATAGDAVELIRRSPPGAGEKVFVIDEAKRLVGVAPAAALLRHRPSVTLEDVMNESPVSVSARARLTSVAGLEAWESAAHLPVTNRRRQVIGLLARRALTQAFDRAAPGGPARDASIALAMGEAFLAGMYGLAQLLADVRPSPARPESDGV